MELFIRLSKISGGLLFITMILSSCTGWHYNNPRVRVDKAPIILGEELSNQPINTEELVTSQTIYLENEANREISNIERAEDPLTASIAKEEISASAKSTSDDASTIPVNASKIKKGKPGIFLFTEKLMDQGRLFKAKDVEKSALSGWLRIMIILFAVGFALMITGVIFSVFVHGGVGWLFYMFGALCILAGFIVLILGLCGVMS